MSTNTSPPAGALYRTFWRWHFYAGLFVIPFVIVLGLSGTVFLFKPQIERTEERAFRNLPVSDSASPSRQVESALAAFPDAHFHSYRLPERQGDAALIHLSMPEAGAMRDVFVSPQGVVMGSFDTSSRIVEIARRIHGQLLLGERGSWLVELVACWAIVMLITGLYLWWPRGRGAAGVIWPRRRSLLRDLHAVTAFWISGFALVLLLTGLPWTDVWGNAFRVVRAEMGWVKGVPQWSTSGSTAVTPGEHASHDHNAMHAGHSAHGDLAALDDLVARAASESFAFPAFVLAPGSALFGPPSTDWVVTSQTQNRPLGVTVNYDTSGNELSRESFADRHPIDRVVGYGLAWHEGALFGAFNQVIGVLTAMALVTMSVTGFLMWRKRRPPGGLGAPALPADRRKPGFVVMATLILAALLPLLAASLLLLWLMDLLLPRLSPAAAAWLGLATSTRPEA
ncbi:MAG: PepSY domain-containing protein [Pseudomonadota bacterium]